MIVDYKTEFYEKVKPDYKAFDEALPAYWSMKYEDRWAKIVEFLPIEKMIGARVLDVGCGFGRALDYFKRYGAKGKGVEPGDHAVENSRLDKREIIHGDFISAVITEQFDVVYFEQVLSHMREHNEAIEKAKELLVPGGLIVIEEPNDNNPLQHRLMRSKGTYWIVPEHVNYFTHESARELLEEYDFEVVYQAATFPMEFFQMMGMEYLGDEEMGKKCHEMRYKLEKEMGVKLRDELSKKWAEIGIGRDLVIMGRKK